MVLFRSIQLLDNPFVAQVIRDVLIEHNVPKVGTAYADTSLDCMFETYSSSKSHYFIVEKEGKIIGGAGIYPLENEAETICELQKMYFLPEARGLGLGAEMMKKCLTFAEQVGYEKCYLETMPYMKDAQKLYKKFGFEYLNQPMGTTGHTSCSVWMLKEIL